MIGTLNIVTNEKSKFLLPILNKWVDALDRFIAQNGAEFDNPWWYNERASVGTLAAAVWLAGGVALEEYSSTKGEFQGEGRALLKPYSGRVDIWASHDGIEWVSESKFHWANLTNGVENVDSLQEAMDQAVHDVDKDGKEAGIRIASVFAVPCFTSSSCAVQSASLDKWLRKAESLKCDACVAYFPLLGDWSMHQEKYFPGVVLFLRVFGSP